MNCIDFEANDDSDLAVTTDTEREEVMNIQQQLESQLTDGKRVKLFPSTKGLLMWCVCVYCQSMKSYIYLPIKATNT